MRFFVTQSVFDRIPNAQFGLVSVSGLDNHGEKPEITKLLNEAIAFCEAHFDGKAVKKEPEVAPYRDAFVNLGINPNKFMSSIEALLTRIAKKKGMPHINSIVDLGNAVSLRYFLPVGAHDLETMNGEFCVKTAGEQDTFRPFGAEEPEIVDPGEVVYATGDEIRTRRWIWRQSENGKILETTSNVLFILDGFDENLDTILTARDELAKALEELFGCRTKSGLINKDSMEFETEQEQ